MSRKLSPWAWGWADRFPEREARIQLGQLLQGMLGITPGEVMDPCEPSTLRAPRLDSAESQRIGSILDASDATRAAHTYGRAYPDIVRGFYGDFDAPPDAVAYPESERDVVRVLEWADEHDVAVIPYGGGTSVVGGVNTALEDRERRVVSMDMRRMGRVLEVDEVSRTARIEAGALGPGLEQQLSAYGLTLRHFPQSFEFSTLGGWLATRSGGHFATVYTHIDDLTASMRAVTPSGTLATRTLPASGAGPSPDRLLLGSEGALGVITEAWMRVRPKPRYRAKADVLFDDFGQAVAATRTLAQSGMFPTNCRLLDRREAMLHHVVSSPSEVLLLGFESEHEPMQRSIEQALALCADFGGVCPDGPRLSASSSADGGAGGSWKNAFVDAPYLQSTMVSMGVLVDTFETACPWGAFEELHADVVSTMRAAMKQVTGHTGFISCRFTHVYPDGPAPYFTFVAPTASGAELEHWRALKGVASDVLMKHRATITHHHAVGRVHLPWYAEHEQPALFGDALRAVKQAWDPKRVLNPGVLGL